MNVSPLVGRPGAVQMEDGAVAVHYGDPLREQRLLAEGAGVVDRSDRDVVAVPGADRLTWLHSLTTWSSPTSGARRGPTPSPAPGPRWSPSWSGCGSCFASSRRSSPTRGR
jgi:hypothetical protein